MNTILRYFPANSDHFTARTLRNGTVFQVKPQKQSFDSVTTWLATLPGQPTAADLRVEEPIHTPCDASWNVSMKGGRLTHSWPTYLYAAIMKYNANLKYNVEVREAFHHLTDVLNEFNTICYTYTPLYHIKWYDFILLKDPCPNMMEWEQIPVSFYRYYAYAGGGLYAYGNRPSKEPFVPQIYAAYKSLYDVLDKHGMISWIRAYHEEQKKKEQWKMEKYEARRKEQMAQRQKKTLGRQLLKLHKKCYTIQQKKNRLELLEAYIQSDIHKMEEQLKNM